MGKNNFSVKWDIEPNCNLKCRHCMMADIKYEQALSVKENKVIARKLIDAGADRIVFQSMEPLMYVEIYKLISYCASRGTLTGLITNGTLLSESLINKLLDARLGYMIISLEGISPKTNDYIRGEGSFNKVLKNIHILQDILDKTDRLLYMILEYNLTSVNREEVNLMFDFFDELPFDVISIGEIVNFGRATENKDIKLRRDNILNTYIDIYSNYYKKKRNYILNTKGLTPYEIVYLNTFYNTDIPFYVVSCSVRNGNALSVSSDGVARVCTILNESKLCGSMELCDLKRTEIFDMKKEYYKVRNEIDLMSSTENRENCIECRHYIECTFCPAADEETHIEARKNCNSARKRIAKNLDDILESKEGVISFSKGVYLEELDNNLYVCRLYKDNNITKTMISIEYKPLLLEMYNDKEYIPIDKYNSKEYIALLKDLIMLDCIIYGNQ